ncbi:MAG: hypothetical protein J7621_01450 [Niastella sp.]|jgi:hypothetical protein|nr:hypothetical protein [Niastella sp.]
MLQKKKVDVDVIKDVLDAMLVARPDSTFVKSLAFQYEERGGLSKKQLEGLYQKALKVESIPENKLATLEAVIRKKPTKYKSAPPPPTPLYNKDEYVGNMIEAILAKYPQHKRVLFFQVKYNNNETLSPPEVTELEKFHRLLNK